MHGAEPIWRNSQKLIQVDIDPTMIGRSKPITLGIVGDCKQFLKQILSKAKEKAKVETREWLENLDKIHQQINESVKNRKFKDETPINPHRMIKEVLEFIDDDAILISDGGNISFHAGGHINSYKERKPLSQLGSVGMGHLGTSVPFGIGAKLAHPNKQVVSISGDGSFMFNIQDLETAVRLGLKNLIFVIGNDSAWGMIKASQKYVTKRRYIDTDFPDFDYARCAEGFGCYGEVVTDPNEIRPALERAKASNKPAVIDVKIKFLIPDLLKTQNPTSRASW
jgi:acetolactate synthase-1/2/3 large subunit